MKSSTAVLWTGGKDSALALFRASDAGASIDLLVTFAPAENAGFHAHPLEQMRMQAQALGIPHVLVPVEQPYRDSYVAALRSLRKERGIAAVVTGDIDLVDGYPNWIEECSRGLDLEVLRPLWQQPREALLRELVARGIEARVSYIDGSALPRSWLGRIIDRAFIDDIKGLALLTNIDICGENGEYHTMVTRFPSRVPLTTEGDTRTIDREPTSRPVPLQ